MAIDCTEIGSGEGLEYIGGELGMGSDERPVRIGLGGEPSADISQTADLYCLEDSFTYVAVPTRYMVTGNTGWIEITHERSHPT